MAPSWIPYVFDSPSLQEAMLKIREKIQQRGDLPYASQERQLQLLEELSAFALGQFFIQNQGALNGYWTHYILSCSQTPQTPLEAFLLQKAPLALATQQRFQIFQQILQENLQEGGIYASIPCGLMGDLLLLDYTNLDTFTLIGIDIDPVSLSQARELAAERGLSDHMRFERKDAWELDVKLSYDWVVSHGLNIYEPDERREEKLYRLFYESLQPGGRLLMSFLTPPPGVHHRSEWDLQKLSMEDLLLQKILFVDLLEAPWRCYKNPDQMQTLLKRVGFQEIQIIYDAARLFPTVLARKPFSCR